MPACSSFKRYTLFNGPRRNEANWFLTFLVIIDSDSSDKYAYTNAVSHLINGYSYYISMMNVHTLN